MVPNFDKSREGLTWQKLFQLFLLFRPRNNYAISKLEGFDELDSIFLESKNIKGIIVDFDGTLAPRRQMITFNNHQRLHRLKKEGFNICIFSNMTFSDRYEDLDFPIITSPYAKPDTRGFLDACKILKLPPKKVIMVGDNFMTDGGAIRAGLSFVYIKPLIANESFSMNLLRLPEKITRWFFSWLSSFYDSILHREVF